MSKQLLQIILNKEHHAYRCDYPEYADISERFKAEGLCAKERMTRRFELLAKLEKPVLLPSRTMKALQKLPHSLKCSLTRAGISCSSTP